MKCSKGKSPSSRERISSDGDTGHGAPTAYKKPITSKHSQTLHLHGKFGAKSGDDLAGEDLSFLGEDLTN
jgi:hypothetical protein